MFPSVSNCEMKGHERKGKTWLNLANHDSEPLISMMTTIFNLSVVQCHHGETNFFVKCKELDFIL